MVQIASVDIATRLDLSGFYQGLGALSGVKTPVIKVDIKYDTVNIGRDKKQLDNLLNTPLTVKVNADQKELTVLNQHIESKRTHVKDVNTWMQANPIKAKVDFSELKSTADLNNTKKITVKVKPEDSDVNNSAKILKDAVKQGIAEGFKESKNKSFIGQIAGFVTAPITIAQNLAKSTLKNVFVGAGERFGQTLTEKIGTGTTQGLETALKIDQLALGEKIGKYVGKRAKQNVVAAASTLGFSGDVVSSDKTLKFSSPLDGLNADFVALGKAIDTFLDPRKLAVKLKKSENALVKILEKSADQKDIFIEDLQGLFEALFTDVDTVAELGLRAVGTGIRAAAVPFRIRKRVRLAQSGKEAKEQAQSIQVPDDIKEGQPISLVTGGINFEKGGVNTYFAEGIMKRLVPGAHSVPVTNPWSNDEDSLGAISKIPKKIMGKSYKPQPLERLVQVAIEMGYNPDSIKMASHAMAYREKYPNNPIMMSGTSGGTYVVEEAIAILERAGIKNIKGLGIAAPLAGLTQTASKKNYQATVGEHDPLYMGMFGGKYMSEAGKKSIIYEETKKEIKAMLPGLIKPNATNSITYFTGKGHAVMPYMAHDNFQNSMTNFLGEKYLGAGIPKDFGGKAGVGNLDFFRLYEQDASNLARTFASIMGDTKATEEITKDDKYAFYHPEHPEWRRDNDLAGYTKSLSGTGKRLTGDNKVFRDEYIEFLTEFHKELTEFYETGKKPIESFKKAIKFYPQLTELANKYTANNTKDLSEVMMLASVKIPETPIPQQIKQETITTPKPPKVAALSEKVAATSDALRKARFALTVDPEIAKAYLTSVQSVISNLSHEIETELLSLSPDERMSSTMGNQLANLKSQVSKIVDSTNSLVEDLALSAEGYIKEIVGLKIADDIKNQYSQQLALAKELEATNPSKAYELLKELVDNAEKVRAELDTLTKTYTKGSPERKAIGGVKASVTKTTKQASAMLEKTGAITEGTTIGREVAIGLTTGVQQSLDTLQKAAHLLSNELIETTKDDLKIESPSKSFMEIGQRIIEGLALGIDGNNELATNAMVTAIEMLRKPSDSLSIFFEGLVLSTAFSKLTEIITALTPAFLEAGKAMESFERRFLFISGSAQQATKSFKFVESEVDKLGTDLKSSLEGYVGLGAATRDTALEGQTQKIFSGVSQASTVYDLNSEQQSRVFTAIQQMAGKGKVSAEELRQQLGEVLPGAFQIAARAMGMTTQALDKMMSEGRLLSEEFLPKFAQQLSAETATGVKGAVNSSVSSLINFNNALFKMQASIGKLLLPFKNLTLAFGSDAIKFVADNAELLYGIFQALSVYMSVRFVGSIKDVIATLLKIPGVSSAASQAFSQFMELTGIGSSKVKAIQFLTDTSSTLQNIKNNPGQSLKSAGSYALSGAKNLGVAILDNAKGGLSALSESLSNLQKNGIASIGANFTKGAAGVKAFGKAALVNGVAGFIGLATSARALMTAIAPILTIFVVIEVGTKVFEGISTAFKDASGDSRNFADTATESLQKYREALAESRGETQKFAATKLVRDESLLDAMGIGALLPKEIKADANWFDKLRFGTGKAITGLVESPANLLKKLSGGRIGATYEDKKLADNLNATFELSSGVNSTTSEALSLLGTKGQGVRELGQLKQYDDQLRQIQTRRAALVATNPQDKAGLKVIDDEQTKILELREKASNPIGILQSNMQSNIDMLKKEIEKYQKLADEPGKNQAQYKNVLAGLQGDLESAQKTQEKFTRAIGESVNAFSLMQKNIQGVTDKLADADDKAVITGNTLKANLYANAKTQGGLQFGLSEIDIKSQEEKIKRLVDAQNQTKELLQNKDAQATLDAYGVTDNTGRAELKTIAEKAGERANDKYVIEQYAVIQERSLEISNLQTGLAQSKYELNQKLVELNKQITEYYTSASRQFAESSLEAQRQTNNLKIQTYATNIRTSISGFQDNIVSQFAESVISSIEQLSEAADKQFDVESVALQANNAFEDSLKQGEELKKQLPSISTTGAIDIPAIPIELDLSKLGTGNSFIDITKAFNESLSGAKDTIENSTDSTNSLTEAFQSVTLSSIDFGDSVQQAVDNTDSGTIATQNLATELLNTTFTASDLGFAIDTNTDSLNANNDAVIATNDSLFGSIEATGNVTASTINWGTETSNVHNVIEDGLKVALSSLPLTLQDIIKNTVDWFSTFANNIPILNSIGQIFNSWGQQLGSVSQSVASFGQGAMQNIGNVMQQGVDFVQNALGMGGDKPPVGNASQPVFPIAGVTYAQAQAKKTSPWGMRRHPVTGQMKMHRGQDYGFGEGTQVVSPMAGVVTGVKYQEGGAGKYVVVESIDEQGRKIEHKFFHLSAYDVVEGQKVNAGDKIGKVGSTGIGTGAHLHYETWINGKNVNPTEFLAGRNGRGINSAQKGMLEQHYPGDGHNHGEVNKGKPNQNSTTPTRISTNVGSAPKLGTGYEALNELGGQLTQNKYFNPSTAEGRGRLALALGIGGSEAFEKNTKRRAFYTYKGGTGNNMQGFGQFNNAYHKEIINTPEKYQNFFGQILAGERRLPNSQKGIGDYGAKVTEAVQSGQIKSGQDLIKWMQANKLGGSNWQGVDDGWKRNPGLADQLVQYLKGELPTQVNSTAANTNNISAPQQIPQIANTPIPTVWTPGSVNTRGNAVINEVTGRAEQQRNRQIELARQKASNEAAQNTATALRNSNKAFLELERGLRENGIKVNSLGNQVTDTNLEYQGALDNEQKRQQEQRKLEEKYSELENNLVEQSRTIQSQVDTAKTLLSKGGIVSPEMRERVQKLIDDPNIKDNLKEQLRTALTTGVLGDDGRNILTRAVSEGEDQLKKLETGLSSVRSGRAESKKLLDERFAREEAVRKQQAGFDIESASLETLKAKLEQLQTLKEKAPFAPDVQGIPALEQVIKNREEQLNLEKQLKEIADKERDKVYTKDEADKLRAEVQARKKIVDATIAQKTEQAKIILQREQENRDREAANELAQSELASDKAKVEQLKLLQQTNPLSPELQNNAIGDLEQRIALREAELQLVQDLATIEQLGIEGKRTPDEVNKLKAGKQEEHQKKVENIKTQGEQTAFASQIAQEKTILSIKQQQLDYQKQVSDVTTQAINLGLQQGDPLKLKFEIDKSELAVNVEKQILDMKEFARSTGKSQEEIAILEQQIRGLNTLSLGNLEAEFNKAVTARATGITSKLSDSKIELLESQASFYSNRGMTGKARNLQRESAILQQQNSYRNQKNDLEEFIKTNQVGAAEAANLRDNLEQVNQVKFDSIKDNFNAFKPVIDSAQSGLKNFFTGIIKGGQSIDDLFKGLMDSILSSVAELASNFLVEKLFGGILGKGKNEGQWGMFSKGNSEGASPLSPIGNILGDATDLGTSPITPMFVNVVNGNTIGGLGSGSGLTSILGDKEDSSNSLIPSLFSGFTDKVDSANPVPVGIIKSNPDALSPITNVLGNVFSGKGGLGSIVGSIGSLFSGGSKGGSGLGSILGSAGGMFGGGGLGGILGIASSLLGSFFWEGGIVGNYAHGGIAGIAEAIGRERDMNGGRAVAIAALTHGERVLNLSQTANLEKLGGIDILNFSDGGTVGYVPTKTEYGGSADKVTESKSQPRDVNVKLETQVINGVEYLTKSQGEELARKAAEQGAMQGARYVSDKLINSPSYRSTHGF